VIIQLQIEMKGIKTTTQAREMGEAIAEHLFNTFNDNGTLQTIQYQAISKLLKEARTA